MGRTVEHRMGRCRLASTATASHTITLDDHTSITDWRQRLAMIAQDIAAKVPAIVPPVALKPGYGNFSSSVGRDNSLRLQSGSTGPSCAVALTSDGAGDVSADLGWRCRCRRPGRAADWGHRDSPTMERR